MPECRTCGKPIARRSIWCRKCANPIRSAALKGRKKPKGFGEKVRKARFNQPMPNCGGPTHPSGKGGGPAWRGYAWWVLRRAALERDGHKCVKCLSDFRIQVHHIKSRQETGGRWDNSPDNLETVCCKCHLAIHRPAWIWGTCPVCGKRTKGKSPRRCCSEGCRKQSILAAKIRFKNKRP